MASTPDLPPVHVLASQRVKRKRKKKRRTNEEKMRVQGTLSHAPRVHPTPPGIPTGPREHTLTVNVCNTSTTPLTAPKYDHEYKSGKERCDETPCGPLRLAKGVCDKRTSNSAPSPPSPPRSPYFLPPPPALTSPQTSPSPPTAPPSWAPRCPHHRPPPPPPRSPGRS